jgi:predicted nucleic acid-binding protein
MALDMEVHRKIGEHLGWEMQDRRKSKKIDDADFEIAKFLIQHNAPRDLVVIAMERLK